MISHGIRRGAAGAGAVSYAHNTEVLLHFENTGSLIEDSSLVNPIISAATNSQYLISTIKKIGTYGLYCKNLAGYNGIGIVIQSTDQQTAMTDLLHAAADWTIDFWWRNYFDNSEITLETATERNGPYDTPKQVYHISDGFVLRGLFGGWKLFRFKVNGITTPISFEFSSVPADGVFHHVAIERHQDTLTVFVDGVIKGTYTGSQNWTIDTGVNGGDLNFVGNGPNGVQAEAGVYGAKYSYFDEFRVSNIARYSGISFTPETTAYTAD